MQTSITRYNAAHRTQKVNGRWMYARSMPVLTDTIADPREAHLQAAKRQVTVVYANRRRGQIDWAALQRHAEEIHVAEALGNLPAVVAEIAMRTERRGTLTMGV